MANPRRQPRHGRRIGRRESALAVRPLQQGSLRCRYANRKTAGSHKGRQRPAWPVRLSAARTVLAGPHRRFPLILEPARALAILQARGEWKVILFEEWERLRNREKQSQC